MHMPVSFFFKKKILLSHNLPSVNRKSTRSTDTRESELAGTRLLNSRVSSSSSQQHKTTKRAQNPPYHISLLPFSKGQPNLTCQTNQNPTMEGRPPHIPKCPIRPRQHSQGKLTNPFQLPIDSFDHAK